jgi:hypothetical protein
LNKLDIWRWWAFFTDNIFISLYVPFFFWVLMLQKSIYINNYNAFNIHQKKHFLHHHHVFGFLIFFFLYFVNEAVQIKYALNIWRSDIYIDSSLYSPSWFLSVLIFKSAEFSISTTTLTNPYLKYKRIQLNFFIWLYYYIYFEVRVYARNQLKLVY